MSFESSSHCCLPMKMKHVELNALILKRCVELFERRLSARLNMKNDND